MTEQDIKALAEEADQKELVVQYRNIARECEELEMALSFPGIRNEFFKYMNLKSFVDAKEKEWPEICGKYKGLYQKLVDLVNAEKAERAKLPWYKRIFS